MKQPIEPIRTKYPHLFPVTSNPDDLFVLFAPLIGRKWTSICTFKTHLNNYHHLHKWTPPNYHHPLVKIFFRGLKKEADLSIRGARAFTMLEVHKLIAFYFSTSSITAQRWRHGHSPLPRHGPHRRSTSNTRRSHHRPRRRQWLSLVRS